MLNLATAATAEQTTLPQPVRHEQEIKSPDTNLEEPPWPLEWAHEAGGKMTICELD